MWTIVNMVPAAAETKHYNHSLTQHLHSRRPLLRFGNMRSGGIRNPLHGNGLAC